MRASASDGAGTGDEPARCERTLVAASLELIGESRRGSSTSAPARGRWRSRSPLLRRGRWSGPPNGCRRGGRRPGERAEPRPGAPNHGLPPATCSTRFRAGTMSSSRTCPLPAVDAARFPDLAAEPSGAVFAERDGLGLYRRLLGICREQLRPGGTVVLQLHRHALSAKRGELPILRAELEAVQRTTARLSAPQPLAAAA